jgi:hypothetical protein
MLRQADQNRRRLVIAASLFGAAPLICASDSGKELPDAVELQDQTGTTRSLFPLKVEASKRYLIDTHHPPWDRLQTLTEKQLHCQYAQ